MNESLGLGVSKIGDLLMNNKITNFEDGSSIEGIVLKIPEYKLCFDNGKNIQDTSRIIL